MSDAEPGRHAPPPPWPEGPPPFTPPAPPPPGPDDSTRVLGEPGALADPEGGVAGEGDGPGSSDQASRTRPPLGARPASAAPPPTGGLPPAAARGLHLVTEQAERLLERPGSLAAWSILLAIAIFWLSSAIGGFAHGSTFRDTFTRTAAYSGLSAGQRLDDFLGVGNYDVAFALLLALGLALLTPARGERDMANGGAANCGAANGGATDSAAPDGGTADSGGGRAARGGTQAERASQRLLLVLTLSGLVVALAALVMFLSDLARAGAQPDASVQGAFSDLAAIPVAVVVSLWAASRVTEWPAWARIAPFAPGDAAGHRHPDQDRAGDGPSGDESAANEVRRDEPGSPPGP